MPVAGGRVTSGLVTPAISSRLLEDLFVRNGMSAYWYPAKQCQCWSELLQQPAETGSPDPACPNCGGRGFVYPERVAVDGVLFTNMTWQTVWTEAGLTFVGSIKLTVPNLPNLRRMYNSLGFADIVIPQDIEAEIPVHVQRGVDTLPYVPSEVLEVTWNGQVFSQGTDYTVSGNTLTWFNQTIPIGEHYLVRFSFQPIYVVKHSLAVLRAFAHENFPRQYVLEYDPNLGDVVLTGGDV